MKDNDLERSGKSWNDNTCIKLVQDRERWNWKVFVCGLCRGAGSVSDGDTAAAADDDDVCLRLVKSNFIQQMFNILFSYFFKMYMNKEREDAPSN